MLRRTLLLIAFCCLAVQAAAQELNFEDGFEDGEFASNPEWTGDIGDFNIVEGAPGKLLQLNADHSVTGGRSYLAAPLSSAEGSWEFYLDFDFAPSGSNFAYIFLMSDTDDLEEGNPNGYALKAGESGSDDVFHIVRFDNGIETTTILSGTTDFSGGGAFRIKVIRQHGGIWSLQVGEGYNGPLFDEGESQIDNTYTNAAYFGILLSYTASRSDKFLFDFKIDLPPFSVMQSAIEDSRIDLIFNRPYDPATLEEDHFIVADVGVPSSIKILSSTSIQLLYDAVFPSGRYTLVINGITDQSGEPISTNTEISFIVFDLFTKDDVLINEFMYDQPAGLSEYVELLNRSKKILNLQNWSLGDQTSLSTISSDTLILEADDFIIISGDTASLFNVFGSRGYIQMNAFPTLNNSGDAIRIHTESGIPVDSLFYTPDWGGENISLERRSSSTASTFKENWGDSPNPFSGTPGLPNEIQPDTLAPTLEALSTPDENTLELHFSERLKADSITDNTSYRLTNGIRITAVTMPDFDHLHLSLDPSLKNAVTYQLSIERVSDIFSNRISNTDTTFTFFKIVRADSGEAFINEFMFDPPSGSSEYIELYNRSSQSFDLQNWTINDNTGTVRRIISSGFVFPPKSFVVLAPDSTLTFEAPGLNLISMGNRFPSLNNGGDDIVLRRSDGVLLDSLQYTAAWSSGQGALERRTPTVSGIFKENWNEVPSGTPGASNQTVPDSLPPVLQSLEVIGDQSLLLVFNERIESNSARSKTNYSLSKGIDVDSVRFSAPDTVRLHLSKALRNAVTYTLTISDITDIFRNSVVRWDTSFTFFKPSLADSSSVFINEFMYDPPPGESEYVEIFNPTDKSFNLEKWTINDNTGKRIPITSSRFILPPENFVVIAPDNTLKASFPDLQLISLGSSFPSLNNSGDAIVLKRSDGLLLDSLTFTSDWGGTETSLERRTTLVNATFPENWGNAPDGFGSPGFQNTIPEDNQPPEPLRIDVINKSTLQLQFTETLETSSAISPDNYSIIPEIPIQNISVHEKIILLSLAGELISGTSYEVVISGLKDVFGNVLTPTEKKVEFVEFSAARKGNLIINEILYQRKKGGPEFVEFLNTTDKNFVLAGWKLGDSSGTVDIPSEAVIKSGEFLVFTDHTSFASSLKNAIRIPGLPALNDNGDAVFIRSDTGTIVDSLFYLPGWGGEEGISIERKDPGSSSNDLSNWQTSISPSGSTAGRINSNFQLDEVPPEAIFATLLAENQVRILFDEFIELTPDLTFFLDNNPLTIVSFNPDEGNSILLKGNDIKQASSHLSIRNLSDVKGNIAEEQQLPLIHPLLTGSVVINEIMFDPLNDPDDNLPDQAEYIELKNTTDYAVSLEGISLHDAPDENGQFRSLLPVTTATRWIPANGIVLIHADEKPAFSESRNALFFNSNDFDSLFVLRIDRNSLGLSSTGDAVFVADSSGLTIDSVFYQEVWHNSNLIDTRGIALERIHPEGASNDSKNWGSSTTPEGGTPGLENTLFQIPGKIPEEIGINFVPNPFSPDNDGSNDNLFINYRLDAPDFLIKIRIFDRYGRPVRNLVDNQPAGFEGSLIWDGRTDDGNKNRIGIYIVLFEAFGSSTRPNRTFKETVVLARRL